ncbi:hypothetical protein [Streptomyces sp. NPDC059649]|uniref:hypothetical protein n=1 Tax=Streptomyces sp. NPDC059649 TaxID=3346895 RepID=UPI00367A1935
MVSEEILTRIAFKARTAVLDRKRALIAKNLPVFEAFFAESPDVSERQTPDGGCVRLMDDTTAPPSRHRAAVVRSASKESPPRSEAWKTALTVHR